MFLYKRYFKMSRPLKFVTFSCSLFKLSDSDKSYINNQYNFVCRIMYFNIQTVKWVNGHIVKTEY